MTPAPARFSRTGSTPQPSPRGTPYDPPTRQSPHSFQPFDTTHLGPGFVSNIDMYWDNPGWRQVFDRLTTFCRLIVWDKRGTGLSDPVHRVPTLDERVEDLLAVMDAAGS